MLATMRDSITDNETFSNTEEFRRSEIPSRLIGKKEVLARVGASYPSIWQWMREGRFPRSRDLGGKVAWIESEIEAWIVSRPIRRLKGDR